MVAVKSGVNLITVWNQGGGPSRRLLLVEDDDEHREAMAGVLRKVGHFVLAAAGTKEAMDIISFVPLDLVLSDVVLPSGSGFDVAAHAKRTRPAMPVVLMSAFVAEDMARSSAVPADDFLRKPIWPSQVLEMVKRMTHGAKPCPSEPLVSLEPPSSAPTGSSDTVLGLLSLISMRDSYTLEHSRRVCRLSVRLARAMGLSVQQISDMATAGWVHDVGKITVPETILNKTGLLMPEEMDLMREHAKAGAAILASLGMSPAVVEAVRYHHERYDGSRGLPYPGYPDGRAGDQIPLLARVLSVVDAFDAMVSARAYRPAQTPAAALNEIQHLAGLQFDPAVARVFLEMSRQELTE